MMSRFKITWSTSLPARSICSLVVQVQQRKSANKSPQNVFGNPQEVSVRWWERLRETKFWQPENPQLSP